MMSEKRLDRKPDQHDHPVKPDAGGTGGTRDVSIEVVLCRCDQRHGHLSCQELQAAVSKHGFRVHLYERLCRKESFFPFLDTIKRSTGDFPKHLIIGACNATLLGGLLDTALSPMSQVATWELIDLRNIPDAEAFLGECQVRCGPEVVGKGIPCTWRPPAERFKYPPRADDPRRVLIIGGGVGGCQTALDLANAGIPVTLVESDLSLGGNMARLDKTFPTLDCSICILGPKLVETASHPGITLLPQSRVTRVSGRPGRFQVEIVRQARHVDMEKCTGCGSCMEVCPVIVPSVWNMGLKPAKAIGLVFEQAVPLRSAIQKEYCIDCGLCEQACEREAITLAQDPKTLHLKVGAIVLAHGARSLNAARLGPLGYGKLPQVITNLEFERLVCSTGPTQGELLTPFGQVPRRIAFIQCAGSRNRRYLPYCSGFCCTASIKEAMLALEHQPTAEITIFFNDIRTTGKNFEGLYLRAAERGVRFIKALPGRIEQGDGEEVIVHYDGTGGGHQRLPVDLVVLAVGLEATPQAIEWALRRPPAMDRYGFYQDLHPWGAPLESTISGVYLAGSCHGPRDITQTVAEASGAAACVIGFFESQFK